jgi:hypothetical protein
LVVWEQGVVAEVMERQEDEVRELLGAVVGIHSRNRTSLEHDSSDHNGDK